MQLTWAQQNQKKKHKIKQKKTNKRFLLSIEMSKLKAKGNNTGV